MSRVYLCITILLLFIAAGCGSKKNDAVDVENAEEFIAAFEPFDLPVRYFDTGLHSIHAVKSMDTSLLLQFIPDSVISTIVGKAGKKYTIEPIGRIENKNGKFLIVKTVVPKKESLDVFLVDGAYKFLSHLKLLTSLGNKPYVNNVYVSEEPTFIISREKTGADDELQYTRTAYSFDATTGTFVEVMHDSNEDSEGDEALLNPIDTFPANNTYSGDYIKNKKNYVSIRDGKNSNNYLFYVRMEKNAGKCSGEIKGELEIVAENKGVYKENAGPCSLNFTFTSKNISLIENNCGNHRGIDCLYNDTFRKNKPNSKSQTK